MELWFMLMRLSTYRINWNGALVKKMEANYWKRRTIEAIQIKTTGETMNLDCGLQLYPQYGIQF